MTDNHRVLGHTRIFGERQGFVSANGFGQWTRVQGVPGLQTFTKPLAINSNNHIVGFARSDGAPRAFLSTNPNSPAQDLGTLPGGTLSKANDINNGGWIVGFSDGVTPLRAVVRPPGGSFVDLNSKIPPNSGWLLTEAMAINDPGRIVGIGIHNGLVRAFMLTPTGTRPLPVWCPPIIVAQPR